MKHEEKIYNVKNKIKFPSKLCFDKNKRGKDIELYFNKLLLNENFIKMQIYTVTGFHLRWYQTNAQDGY